MSRIENRRPWLAAFIAAVFTLFVGATSVLAQGASPTDRGLPGCPGPVEAEDGFDVPCIALISFDESTSSKPGRNNVVLGAGAVMHHNYSIVNAAAVVIPTEDAYWDLIDDPAVTALYTPKALSALDSREIGPGDRSILMGSQSSLGSQGAVSSQSISPQQMSTGLTRIRGEQVWGTLGVTGLGVGVATMDTGVDKVHPDLQNNLAREPGGGVLCFDAFDNLSASRCQDDDTIAPYHGTHVAGIIAAEDNDIDTVGVSPDATIYAAKVLDANGGGSDLTLLAGLDWVFNLISSGEDVAAGAPIRVINMSLGAPFCPRAGALDPFNPCSIIDTCAFDSSNPSDLNDPNNLFLLHEGIRKLYGLGIAFASAAGNLQCADVDEMWPAGWPEVMAVASSNSTTGPLACGYQVPADSASVFTTDGQFTDGVGVTITAPGALMEVVGIPQLCGIQVEVFGILSLQGDGNAPFDVPGTSQAAPHLAGTLALMAEACDTTGQPFGNETARGIVRATADGIGSLPLINPLIASSGPPCLDGECEGILDAFAAVEGGCAVAPNLPPVLDPVGNKNVSETGTLAFAVTATDPEAETVTFSMTGQPAGATLNPNTGAFSYTPDFDVSSQSADTVFSVIFFATAIGGSDSESISISVNNLNRRPTATGDILTTDYNTPLMFNLVATDADGDTLTYFYSDPAPASGVVTGAGPEVTFTPVNKFIGDADFGFLANDGLIDSVQANITIHVTAPDPGGNTAPSADDQSVGLDEDTDTAITLTGSDLESDPLTYIVITSPSQGVLSGSAPALTYTPNPDYNGADSFTFRVEDGSLTSNTATVSITVTPVNDAPTATPQSVSTNQDTAVNITLSGSDIDGDSLTFAVTAQPSNGSLIGVAPDLTYTPTGGSSNADSFTFTVDDGTAPPASATVSITVNVVAPPSNQAPTAVDDAASMPRGRTVVIAVLANDSDPENDSLSIGSFDSSTSNGGVITLNADNTLTYKRDKGFKNGIDTFVYHASDSAADSNQATVTVYIGNASPPANQPPVADAGADQTMTDTDEGGSELVNLDGSGSNDPDGTVDIYVWREGGSLLATGATPAPVSFAVGSHTVVLTVTDDGGAIDTDTVVITVNAGGAPPANQSPVANAGADQTVTDSDDDGLEQLTLDGSGSSDPDGTATIASYEWEESGALVATGVAPSVTLSVGEHTIDLTVTDNDGAFDTDTVVITVAAAGTPPATATTSIVTSITFDFKGKNLKFTVRVEDNLGNPVGSAMINGSLSGPLGAVPFSAPTKANGQETFIIRSPPTGFYSVTITGITATDLTWDGKTPSNGYTVL